MTAPQYYLIGSIDGSEGTLARVMNHEYRYLDLETGAWVFDPTVTDSVHFEASTQKLTLKQAKENVQKRSSPIEPVWIDG